MPTCISIRSGFVGVGTEHRIKSEPSLRISYLIAAANVPDGPTCISLYNPPCGRRPIASASDGDRRPQSVPDITPRMGIWWRFQNHTDVPKSYMTNILLY